MTIVEMGVEEKKNLVSIVKIFVFVRLLPLLEPVRFYGPVPPIDSSDQRCDRRPDIADHNGCSHAGADRHPTR